MCVCILEHAVPFGVLLIATINKNAEYVGSNIFYNFSCILITGMNNGGNQNRKNSVAI
jgi:hypothetical protein